MFDSTCGVSQSQSLVHWEHFLALTSIYFRIYLVVFPQKMTAMENIKIHISAGIFKKNKENEATGPTNI